MRPWNKKNAPFWSKRQPEPETDLPTTRTIDHKLRVEAKMDYNKCKGEIEDKIAQEFARIFKTPAEIKYLGSGSDRLVADYKRFSTGDLTWKMCSWYSQVCRTVSHSFQVYVDGEWHPVSRPADLWIALGYGDKL